jgi:cytochrome P450
MNGKLRLSCAKTVLIAQQPGPPHSWLWGHLKVMGEMMNEIPYGAHPHCEFSDSAAWCEKHQTEQQRRPSLAHTGTLWHHRELLCVVHFRLLSSVLPLTQRCEVYMDLWPLADPIFYVFDPDMANQVVEQNLPKHRGIAEFMIHLAGPGDLVSSGGAHWKKWRSIMNPGFASGHLMTLVSGIVDDSLVFCDKMVHRAEKNEVFRLEEDATRLTVDIIGKVTLDLRLNTQRSNQEMVVALREQVHLLPIGSMLDSVNMWRPYDIWRRWRNSQIMNRYIGNVLDERFARSDASTTSGTSGQKKERKRAILDLALNAYQAQRAGTNIEKGSIAETSTAPVMDAEFKKMAITQLRTFIFAGHDTTSSTIAYALYELHRHPDALRLIREEHDRVLGPIEQTAQRIKDDPYVLNELEYTSAVVKETLRLWPAASSTRMGGPDAWLHDPKTGEQYPTDKMLVWILHYCMHRSKAVWGPNANEFDPKRFFPENESKLPDNGWRPFEKGSRNCIGQELAMIESRVILALTCRSFDFIPAFDALDELANDGSYYTKGGWKNASKRTLDGEEAYGVLIGTAKYVLRV